MPKNHRLGFLGFFGFFFKIKVKLKVWHLEWEGLTLNLIFSTFCLWLHTHFFNMFYKPQFIHIKCQSWYLPYWNIVRNKTVRIKSNNVYKTLYLTPILHNRLKLLLYHYDNYWNIPVLQHIITFLWNNDFLNWANTEKQFSWQGQCSSQCRLWIYTGQHHLDTC